MLRAPPTFFGANKMAIKLKKIQRAKPGAPDQLKWYLTQSTTGAVNIKDITDEIVQRTSLSRGDVQNVLVTLVDVMPTFLKVGQSIRLGDFGTFRVSATSPGKDTPEALTTRDATARIVFIPASDLKLSITNASFEMVV